MKKGFKETKSPHRLLDKNSIHVDIVPFGKLEEENSNIYWPLDSDIEMSVLGYKEAYENSIEVTIKKGQLGLNIPVASALGLVLLKLISWSERDRSVRKKDAQDFVYLIESYERVDNIQERLYPPINIQTIMNQSPVMIALTPANMPLLYSPQPKTSE
ncbi:MAG: hypothetical protein ISR69_12245 [Gammaproteobacteria bacterium]|nr:hypothetical protein [Gammaproteobacteria bacterium]